MEKRKIVLSFLIVFSFLFAIGCNAHAEGLVPASPNEVAGCKSDNCGDYQLSDFEQILFLVADFILGITGALMLLMFVYGGFTWLTSAGNKERVEKGRQAIVAAVIGLVIVFSSYLIIEFVKNSLEAPDDTDPVGAGYDAMYGS